MIKHSPLEFKRLEGVDIPLARPKYTHCHFEGGRLKVEQDVVFDMCSFHNTTIHAYGNHRESVMVSMDRCNLSGVKFKDIPMTWFVLGPLTHVNNLSFDKVTMCWNEKRFVTSRLIDELFHEQKENTVIYEKYANSIEHMLDIALKSNMCWGDLIAYANRNIEDGAILWFVNVMWDWYVQPGPLPEPLEDLFLEHGFLYKDVLLEQRYMWKCSKCKCQNSVVSPDSRVTCYQCGSHFQTSIKGN